MSERASDFNNERLVADNKSISSGAQTGSNVDTGGSHVLENENGEPKGVWGAMVCNRGISYRDICESIDLESTRMLERHNGDSSCSLQDQDSCSSWHEELSGLQRDFGLYGSGPPHEWKDIRELSHSLQEQDACRNLHDEFSIGENAEQTAAAEQLPQNSCRPELMRGTIAEVPRVDRPTASSRIRSSSRSSLQDHPRTSSRGTLLGSRSTSQQSLLATPGSRSKQTLSRSSSASSVGKEQTRQPSRSRATPTQRIPQGKINGVSRIGAAPPPRVQPATWRGRACYHAP